MSNMRRHSDRDHGRFAAALFAATVVITGGGGICLAIAFCFAPDDVWLPAGLVVGGIAALSFVIWLLTSQPLRKARNSNIYAAQRETLNDYVESFRPDLRRRQSRHFGTNKPPTAGDLRQIKEDSNSWYPSERRVEQYRKALGDEQS